MCMPYILYGKSLASTHGSYMCNYGPMAYSSEHTTPVFHLHLAQSMKVQNVVHYDDHKEVDQ